MAEEALLDSFDEDTFLDTLAEDTPEVAYSALEYALDPVAFAESKSIAQSLKDSLANLETSLLSLKDVEFLKLDSSCEDSTFPTLAYGQPMLSCGLCLRNLDKPKECRRCHLQICADCWINLEKCPRGCPQTVFKDLPETAGTRSGHKHGRCFSVGCQPDHITQDPPKDSAVKIQEKCANPTCSESVQEEGSSQHLQVCSDTCAVVCQTKHRLETTPRDHQLSIFVRMLSAAKKELYEETRAELLPVYAELDQKRRQVNVYLERKTGLKKQLSDLRNVYNKQCL